jgi:LmbE family N-acetylglucosaminyl deacetylase
MGRALTRDDGRTPNKRRILVSAAAALAAALLLALLAVAVHLYATEQDVLGRVLLEVQQVDDLQAVSETDRLLVLLPHPDDEVLCTAGLLQKATSAGADVRVVFLTLGDGNLPSFQVYSLRPVVTPGQVLNMGQTRAREALEALRLLGVSPEQTVFLGYPDSGTLRLWEAYWSGTGSYRQRLTAARQVPYDLALSTGAPYIAESVLDDIKELISTFVPTVIFTSHPDDQNADHQALWLFTRAALLDLGAPYVDTPTWSCLVHQGTWPSPYGHRPDSYLLPPDGLASNGMEWVKLLLSEEQMATKRAALARHPSQMRLRGYFLQSFVRQNELFAAVPAIQLSSPLLDVGEDGVVRIFGAPRTSLLKYMTPGFHLDKLGLSVDGPDLLLSASMARPLGRHETLSLELFPQSTGLPFAEMPKLAIVIGAQGLVSARDLLSDRQQELTFTGDGSRMTIRLNLASLSDPEALFLAATMRSSGMAIARTGWRLISLEPQPSFIEEQLDRLAVS